ncbi:MAG: C40 family peptidase [Pseudooceanicola sp.]
MSLPDRRRWPCNGRVAAEDLRGKVAAERFVAGLLRQVTAPVADLLDAPRGTRDRQVMRGEMLRVLEERDGHAFVQAEKDGYCGYVAIDAIDRNEMHPDSWPNAIVRLPATHAYPGPDIETVDFKLRPLARYSMGARLHVFESNEKWALTDAGCVPAGHLSMLSMPERDPVAVAERFLHMPYLWGGNGYEGIDCSGLVQAACIACGIDCPGDSDMQAGELGDPLPEDAAPERGDLMFWKGHVAWVVDPGRILHANVFHMAVAYEGLDAAVARIAEQGDGPVTGRRRLARA